MHSPYICFEKKESARTGNILFQYLFCKVITLVCNNNHTHIPIEEFPAATANQAETLYIYENTIKPEDLEEEYLIQKIHNIYYNKNIICSGYFQDSRFFAPFREQLLAMLANSPQDHWISCTGRLEYISAFLTDNCKTAPVVEENAIVVSLRLDDFIQLPCQTSDIIPPKYYINILHSYLFENPDRPIYIVCDTIRHNWEIKYLEHFREFNYVLIQSGSLSHDCQIFRNAKFLIHSNSSLCWIMSFFGSAAKKRFIPRTGFYSAQYLDKIDEATDIVINVKPLIHSEIFEMEKTNNVGNGEYGCNKMPSISLLQNNVFPLSYSIPDECIMSHNDIDNITKQNIIAPLIPGDRRTYIYKTEEEYYNMYKDSYFAYTGKKGGWDCLRHYEIFANGCIPIFNEIKNCPNKTLTTFPRQSLEYKADYFNETTFSVDFNEQLYLKNLIKMYLKYTKSRCSTSASAKYFLEKMNIVKGGGGDDIEEPLKILMLRGNCGVNYTRELLWIGLHRIVTENDGEAVEYPPIDYLYDDYPAEKSAELYGNGFTYSRRLQRRRRQHQEGECSPLTENDLINKIQNHYWDIIIYGKVGPDEDIEGSFPHLPLWDYVSQHYNRDKIAFLYGGDECQDMRIENKYSRHLLYHLNFAKCFVRELAFPEELCH